ncbi:hypothetical protein [Pedobacter chitinilyticus]|uniref:Lipoprotein n=1 Tax=Pedobacter chitinilyticus TaxID=2233776 RepID=A0A3S3PZ18_9SPHI|nr:hypothetical protein [Pedobacter chitinilyticus]RWU07565.1 hypothetical protein DPV69_11300 [Pedobacter chitinilyticus]
MQKASHVNTLPLVLLTGCINPEGMIFTKLQNPERRRLQYIDAINFYLNNTENVVVFVENSGVDLSDEFKGSLHKDRLEVITFFGNSFDRRLGKGYGEMLILKHAFENSTFIKKSVSIFKITGRYKLLNFKSILRSYQEHHCNIMVDLPRQLKYSDSRVFIADKIFFTKFLFPTAGMIDDSAGYYFEHALSRAVLLSIIEEKYKYLPFKYYPRLKGESGTDGLNYDYSFSYWVPQNIKQIIQFKLFSREWDVKYIIK